MTASMARTEKKVLRLGAYLRLSEKKSDDDEKDTDSQLVDCQREAKRRGGTIVKSYVENDTSAFKQKRVTLPDGTVGLRVRRDVFQALFQDLYNGVIDGFVGYHLDRIARQPRDLEDLIDLVKLKAVKIYGVDSDLDLSTDHGIMAARMGVLIANQSSRDTARRVARWHRYNQEAGKPGGGVRPFGFLPDRINHDPREAEAIKWASAHVISGGTLSTVVAHWNNDGLMTTRGNPWRVTSVRATLKNPRLAGRRARWVAPAPEAGIAAHWAPVTVDGAPVKAVWDGIISGDEFDALQDAMKRAVSASKGISREGARKYLLSGIARCGGCGAALRGTPNARQGNYYACPPANMGGCGGVSRPMAKVDALVETAVLTALAADLAGEMTEPAPWAGEAELARLEALLGDLKEAWKSGKLASPDYFSERSEIETEVKVLHAQKRSHARTVQEFAEAVDVAKHWGRASLVEKRQTVRSTIKAIVVHPLPVVDGRKLKGWNPELIEIL